MGASAAGNGSWVVLDGKLGNVDLQHAARRSGRNVAEGDDGLDGVGVWPTRALQRELLAVEVVVRLAFAELADVGGTDGGACSRNKLRGRRRGRGETETPDEEEETVGE